MKGFNSASLTEMFIVSPTLIGDESLEQNQEILHEESFFWPLERGILRRLSGFPVQQPEVKLQQATA